MERAFAAVISSCRAVICSSLAERDDLLPMTSLDQRGKLRVIHNGVDPPPPVTDADRAALRAELGVAAGTSLALFVGQLEARKQPLLAARAAIRARELGAPITLVVVGEGAQASDLRALAGDVVKLLGPRDDVPRLLAAADLFVQPSEREGMSFALLEALSYGLAIVAADASSNPEAVADAGVLFPPGDEAAFASALHRVGVDAELARTLGARARSRAAERFSPADFLSASESVYAEAVMAPDRAGPGRHV
jgi:glycosyltransferase involved in cell wall biosynthesis